MEKRERPKIREDKCRFNLTIPMKHKQHLEKIAEDLGISLNSLFIMTAMTMYPFKEEECQD